MRLLLSNVRWYSEGGVRTGDLRLGQGRVLETGNGLAPRGGERIIDGDGYLALPGLINGHDHLDLNLFPRLGSPPYDNFYAWGEDVYRPEESPVRDILRVPLADRLSWSAYKQLVSGVTTVVHHDPYHRAFGRRFPIKVLERYGWSHSLGHGPDVGVAFARSNGYPYIIHAAEGVDAAAAAEIEELDRLGVLASNTVLVHGIAASDAQVRKLAERRVALVWCPSSNLHLYGKTAPVDLLKGRVGLSLGTDSTLSGAPTLWDELRAARATGLATPAELLEMVTTAAAAVFGIDDGRGTLRPGAPADLLLVAEDETLGDAGEIATRSTPAAVALVLVDGQPRLADPRLADRLDLGPVNAHVEGQPRWLTGSLGRLRARILRKVDAEILERNPLWSLFDAREAGVGKGTAA